MTLQHHEEQADFQLQTPGATDPIGPITLPKRAKVGARSMALVGAVGMSTFAAAAVTSEYGSPWPTI